VRRHRLIGALSVAVGMLSFPIAGQANPAHHVGDAGVAPAPSPTTSPPGMAGTSDATTTPPAPAMGGMGAMMAPASGCMGDDCGAGAGASPLYSSLMTMEELTPEKRAEIDALATRQIDEGMAKLVRGAESLTHTTRVDDHVGTAQAAAVMHEGLDQLEAGVAARRVLTEGKAPRNLALDWFKREMNLAMPVPHDRESRWLGLTLVHWFTMALLAGFALAMVAMYFFKMRRAAALFRRIETKGPPPPGSAPPLGGAPTGAPPGAAPSTGPLPAKAAPPSAATRSATPVVANWRGNLRVQSIVTETPSVKTFRLAPSSGEGALPFTFVPGQFLNVAFWIGGARMNRSYSISSSPTEREHVELTVRREPRGAVSRHIHDLLKVGDEIEASGPVGRFTFSGTDADSIVLIAGGVGITPMMSIARYLTDRSWPGDIFFVFSCRAPDDFIFREKLASLQRRNPKLRVLVTMSGAEGTDWKGPRGRLTKELLTETIPDLPSRRIQLCGPPPMMEATKAILTELGVPPDQVKTEAFGATKPSPSPVGTSATPSTPATGPLVTFSKNTKSSKIRDGQTVLELSEELGIGIENSCRVGTCGVCKVKLTAGEVTMAVEDALDAEDKAAGIILACQAIPAGPITVEA
jgi:ferredoxin-NADP reductase